MSASAATCAATTENANRLIQPAAARLSAHAIHQAVASSSLARTNAYVATTASRTASV